MSQEITDLLKTIDNEAPINPALPRLNRVIAIAPVGLQQENVGTPYDALGHRLVHWAIHKPHPLIPDGLTVVRMYQRASGIKIYSVANDGSMGVLNFVPAAQVLATESVMEQDILLDELELCEAGKDEDAEEDDDDPDAPDDPEPVETAPANGQTTAS